MLLHTGHSFPVDWWALGILSYELLFGKSPFAARDPLLLYKNILHGEVAWPPRKTVRDRRSSLHAPQYLIEDLLDRDTSTRLGSSAEGARKIYTSEWLASLEPQMFVSRVFPAPFVPKDEHTESIVEPPESDFIHFPEDFPSFAGFASEWVMADPMHGSRRWDPNGSVLLTTYYSLLATLLPAT